MTALKSHLDAGIVRIANTTTTMPSSFDRHQIVVRRGTGQKDVRTMLPVAVRERLQAHLGEVKRQHERHLSQGLGRAVLPFALDRKYPNASTDWVWQFVFPAARICRDPRRGPPSRFHLHESVLSRVSSIERCRSKVSRDDTKSTFSRHTIRRRNGPSYCTCTETAFKGPMVCFRPPADLLITFDSGVASSWSRRFPASETGWIVER